jgi:hypothetical protein
MGPVRYVLVNTLFDPASDLFPLLCIVGSSMTVVPAYMSECAPPAARGGIVAVYSVFSVGDVRTNRPFLETRSNALVTQQALGVLISSVCILRLLPAGVYIELSTTHL